MKTTAKTNSLIELLLKDKKSGLHTFRNNVPKDDLTYFTHWFTYFDYVYGENDLLLHLMNSYEINLPEIESGYITNKNLSDTIEEIHEDVLSEIQFEPRLDQYLNLFEPNERANVKLLILANWYMTIHKNNKYYNLLELGRYFRIDKAFIFSLSDSHKLFQDKILENDNSSLQIDSPWMSRDMVFNPVVFNIFSNLAINPEELAIIKESPILELFDLVDPSFTTEILKEEAVNLDLGDETNMDSFDQVSFEKLFTEEKEEEKEEFIENIQENEINQVEVYRDNLDYLYHEYLYYNSLVKLKEKETDDFFTDKDDDRRIRLLERKIQKQRFLCDSKLEKSKSNGFEPRLEKFAKKLKLNNFEKNVLKALISTRIFIDPKKSFSSSNNITVKEIIYLLIDNPKKQIHAKKYFQKKSILIRSGCIRIEHRDSLNSNLFDSDIIVDNRLLDYASNNEFNISDHIDGSFFGFSKIKMENVKIPTDLKQKVLSTINNFPTFLEVKKNLGFSEALEYGNSLVMLFVGKSGTGKTMLSNAISNYLHKKILQFNLNNFSQLNSLGNEQQIFSVLFREARMKNAILFFDESEALLQGRFNDLLIEIEKHEGIVIFATNASFSIDEAMRRRINLILNLPDPGPMLRKDIWQMHLPKNLTLDKDVNLEHIARRFELNGGLIKNAVYSALAQASNESKNGGIELKMKNLEYGAKEQLHNKLFMSNLEKSKIPLIGLDKIVHPSKTAELIDEIVNIEKSWKFLDAEWGFNEVFPDHHGVSVLFHGPSGTGKTLTAEAIAYEMGRKLKIVNYSQIMSMYVGGTEKALESLFEEAADKDDILLFDEADALFSMRTNVSGANDRYANVETDVLLSIIERYNVFTILTTNLISNIDSAFFRRMSYIIEFKRPDKNERFKIWNNLLPEKMPLHKDVDLEELAIKYSFTGGEIRNCVIRVGTKKGIKMQKNMKVSQQDFINICNEIKNNKINEIAGIGFRN